MQVPSAALGAHIGQRAVAAAAGGLQLLRNTRGRELPTSIPAPALLSASPRLSAREEISARLLGGVRLRLFNGGSEKASRTAGRPAPRVTASTVTTEEKGKEKEQGSSGGGGGAMTTPQVPPPQPLAKLFAPFEAYRTGMLQVSPVHKVYFEESGNPKGQPVIFLHGGPGGGTTPNNRRFFDPQFYRIVLMDQRGCGKSTPHACLEDNTTWHLVADIEALRKELKIEKWLVFGGSWGSTLSLAYASSHPEAVQGLILRGVFLLRSREIEWFYQQGADIIFPDVFEPYRTFIPEDERHDLVTAYNKRLMDDSNPDMQMAAARRWTDWEMRTSYLVLNQARVNQGEDDKFALAFARIENHYFFNKGFFSSDNYLLENVHKIRHLPCIIVQGRYDVVCPFRWAWDLHQAWPEADFKVVPDAGHSANELGITSELVKAAELFKQKLGVPKF